MKYNAIINNLTEQNKTEKNEKIENLVKQLNNKLGSPIFTAEENAFGEYNEAFEKVMDTIVVSRRIKPSSTPEQIVQINADGQRKLKELFENYKK